MNSIDNLHICTPLSSSQIDIKKCEGIRPNARMKTCHIHLHSICKIISILLIWIWALYGNGENFSRFFVSSSIVLFYGKYRMCWKWNLNEISSSSTRPRISLSPHWSFRDRKNSDNIQNLSSIGFLLFEQPRKSFLWFHEH